MIHQSQVGQTIDMADRESVHSSVVSDSVTPQTAAHQAPLSMWFARQEYWGGLPCTSPGDLPDPGIECWSPTLQADSSSPEPPQASLQVKLNAILSIKIYTGLHVPAVAFNMIKNWPYRGHNQIISAFLIQILVFEPGRMYNCLAWTEAN